MEQVIVCAMPTVRRLVAVAGAVVLGSVLTSTAAAGPSTTVAIDAEVASVDGRLHLAGTVVGSKDDVVVYRASECTVTGTGAVECDFERYRKVEQARDGGFSVPLEVPEKAGLGKAFFWQARVAGADTDVWRTYRLDP